MERITSPKRAKTVRLWEWQIAFHGFFFHLDVKYDLIYIFCYQINNTGRAGRVETTDSALCCMVVWTSLTRPPICICVHFVWCIRPVLTCECQCFPSASFERITSRHQTAPTFTNWCFLLKFRPVKVYIFLNSCSVSLSLCLLTQDVLLLLKGWWWRWWAEATAEGAALARIVLSHPTSPLCHHPFLPSPPRCHG